MEGGAEIRHRTAWAARLAPTARLRPLGAMARKMARDALVAAAKDPLESIRAIAREAL